ncbi:hypothetical protein BH09PSE5_BH09PSE5_29220 [soil metagenome]
MQTFLANNRDELVARCKAKVATRPHRGATALQVSNGVPMFLGQLMKTLLAEEAGQNAAIQSVSGASNGGDTALSEIGTSAQAHGRDLLSLGYTVDQVVHDYGDLCQAITELAIERDAPFTIAEFRTLNRCLDNAIADAVTAFSAERDEEIAYRSQTDENERQGALVHELRNVLHTALLAFAALETGSLPIGGSTGGVLKRSLASLSVMLGIALTRVRLTARMASEIEVLSVASLVRDAELAAQLDASERGCTLNVLPVDTLLDIEGNRVLLFAALYNLLHNAIKFTHKNTQVTLRAYAEADRVLIEVMDHCGGLAPGVTSRMFLPFAHFNRNIPGLGLGLSIARASVEADGGMLTVQDMPGIGCVFTINLPSYPIVEQ